VARHRRVDVKGNLEVSVGPDGGVYKLDATDSVTVTARNSIVLKCGESSIRIEPEQIVLISGTKSKIVMDGNIVARSSGESVLSLDAGVRATASGQATLELDQNVKAKSAGGASLALDPGVAVQGATISLKSPGPFEVKAGLVSINK
jgi:uncharacterized protein (DUF2345 family)